MMQTSVGSYGNRRLDKHASSRPARQQVVLWLLQCCSDHTLRLRPVRKYASPSAKAVSHPALAAGMHAGLFGMLAAAAHVSTCMPWKPTGLTTDSGSCVTATSPEIDHTWPNLDRDRNRAAELDLEVAIPLLRRGNWLSVLGVGRQVQPRVEDLDRARYLLCLVVAAWVWSHSVRSGLHVVEVLYVSPEMIVTRASLSNAFSAISASIV